MGETLTLRILKNTSFPDLYRKFMMREELSNNEVTAVLSVAVFFVNHKENFFQRMGYRIIVEYSNRFHDYKPLYEIALNSGLFPICKLIEERYTEEQNFFTVFNDALIESIKDEKVYPTSQQFGMKKFFEEGLEKNISIVAPTSYGKSELIIEAIKEYVNRKICVVSPTKALLMQTKSRIKKEPSLSEHMIVVHPEMYNEDDTSCIAVLTQERLLRLFKMFPGITFDCVIIDEAHEILVNDGRSNLLASVMILAKKRNPNVVFKFLTPFVSDGRMFQTRYARFEAEHYRISEYVKTEKYFIHDLREKRFFLYDQFVNDTWELSYDNSLETETQVVKKYSGSKNIVYLNKPVDIESFALELAMACPEIISQEIEEAISDLSKYIDPHYHLVTCLRHGIIYHHSSVPDVVRGYVENLYKYVSNVKYIITTSTLLSGVNLPAEKMFILDNRRGKGYLSASAFNNLIGRVCRFNEVFNQSTGDLRMLEPEIHVVVGRYFKSNADYKKHISEVARADKSIQDLSENVLLVSTEITAKNTEAHKTAETFIENCEKGVVENYNGSYAKTIVGRSSFLNGIQEIDIIEKEERMQQEIDREKESGELLTKPLDLINQMWHVFVSNLRDNSDNSAVKRLQHEKVRVFYAMMIDWQMANKSFAEMIWLIKAYWKKLLSQQGDPYVFVGRWGNISRNEEHQKNYIDLREVSEEQLTNYAIVRIKEERDFIDNRLMKYIETLNDMDVIDGNFYKMLKYGTINLETICLIKNGMSLTASTLLQNRYREYLIIDTDKSRVIYDTQLIERMRDNGENGIVLFEVKNNL